MWPWGGGAPEIDIGYNVPNSLMLDKSLAQLLSRTMSLQATRTLSMWVKFGDVARTGTSYRTFFYDGTNGRFHVKIDEASGVFPHKINLLKTSPDAHIVDPAVRRDPNSWLQLVIVQAASLTSIYVNGVLMVAEADAPIAISNSTMYIGAVNLAGAAAYDGYLANVILVDGQALDPSYFGRTSADTGAWVNKDYTGTYGTNGFKLEFLNGAALGTDTSGNGNHWTLNGGITSANQYTDTPTNNFATLSPLGNEVGLSTSGYLTRGNLKIKDGPNVGYVSSQVITGNKLYLEHILTVVGAQSIGLCSGLKVLTSDFGTTSDWFGFYMNPTANYVNGTSNPWGAGVRSNGDIIRMAVDATNPASIKLWMGINAVWYDSVGGTTGNPDTGANPTQIIVTGIPKYIVAALRAGTPSTGITNFGATPFTYTPPTGFKSLCTANLPQPSIIKPVKYFKAKTRTGTGAAYNVTGLGFSPDLVWSKSRSNALSHMIADSVRGIGKYLSSDTAAEVTDAQSLTSFNADGYSGGTAAINNTNAATYVDWMWDKGVIPGVDIVSYVGTGVNRTVAHNLGVAPRMLLIKDRTGIYNWLAWHVGLTSAAYYLNLNTNIIQTYDATQFNSTAPTSSVFSVGTAAQTNTNTNNYIAYLFAEVEGFSKFGSYVGNGSTDGTFVNCGFRPAFVMWKRTDALGSWFMSDSTRQIYNPSGAEIYAESNVAESVVTRLDYVSNGFKLRAANTGDNASGGTYIFMAFAEMPLKYANAR